MFNFLTQSAAQILILDDREVRRFVWDRRTLSFDRSFTRDEEGLARFRACVILNPELPAIIVTDFIEESFRNETIAHVTASDRNAILQRRLDYTFRNTPFRIARVTGREQHGRRDDHVLLSAINKPSLIQPWLDPLLEYRVRIQSITSLAYLLEAFVGNNGKDKIDNLLIISIDRGLKLRQTYLKKGRVLFSRSTLVSARDSAALANDIYLESQRIRRYLERIRLLKNETPLQVHIYSLRSPEELTFDPKPYDYIFPEVINAAEVIEEYSVDLKDHKPGALVLFLLQTMLKRQISNTYAPFAIRKYHHLRNIARGCMTAAVLVVAGAGLLQTPVLLETLDKQRQQDQLAAQTLPLQREYDALRQRFPETPVPSRQMELVVSTWETILDQTYSPSLVLSRVSQALGSAPALELNEIHWQLHPQEPDNSAFIEQYGYAPPQSNRAASIERSIIRGDTALGATISGMAQSANSFREAQNLVQNFANALASIPGLNVTPVRMPTDVRLDSAVNTTVNDGEVRAAFTLDLHLEREQ